MSVLDRMFYDPRDEWVVVQDDERREDMRTSLSEDHVLLGWKATAKELAAATRLRFLVEDETELPSKMFAAMTNVRELSMPARWLSSLTPKLAPPKLRLLDLDGSKSVKWPDSLVLPELEYLAHSDAPLHVTPAQVPALRGLAVDVGVKSKIAPHLRGWPHLVGLSLTVVNDEKTLAAAPLDRLEHLGIVGGKLDSVKGLSGTPIKSLQLKNLVKLTSLAGVDKMAELETLDLQYLSHITDLDLLLQIPRLTKVSFMSTGTKAEIAKIQAHVEKNRARIGKST